MAADMTAQRTEAALTAKAEDLMPQLKDGAGFADLGLDSIEEADQARNAFIQNTPRSFVSQVFEMEEGDVNLITGQGMVVIVRLDQVLPAADNAEATPREVLAAATAVAGHSGHLHRRHHRACAPADRPAGRAGGSCELSLTHGFDTRI